MKSFAKFCFVLLAACFLADSACQAQSNLPSLHTNATARGKRNLPKTYIGTVASVDSIAKTITLTLTTGESETFYITARSHFRKDNGPATLSDVPTGEKIRVIARRDDSGKLVAAGILIGEPKPVGGAQAPQSH